MSEALPRVLIIVSGDFGELANSLALIKGANFEATLLVPKRLFAANNGEFPVTAVEYVPFDDTVKVWKSIVEELRPDVVMLFSAYLYAINRIMSQEDISQFLSFLRERNIPTATTDPFLGILTQIDEATFGKKHPGRQELSKHFLQLKSSLNEVPHVYLCPPPQNAPSASVSFFNPAIILTDEQRAEHSAKLLRDLPLDEGKNRWLFILSTEDFALQSSRVGIDRFHDLLARRMFDTVRCGRQPVLIAPQPCLESLITRDRPIAGLIPVSHGSHSRFASLQMDAEYVFYWNIFSNSIISRVANRLPIFFFDLGHLVHSVPAILDVGLSNYYPDCELPALDQEQPLAERPLEIIAESQDETLEGARVHFAKSPYPDQMIEMLRKL